MIQAGSGTKCEKGIRYLGSHYQLPPEISDLFGSSDVYITACMCLCLYPPPECTIDRHFVFYVPASITEPPLSPALLVAASNSTCKPQKVTPDYALFKIPMDGCGTRRVVRFNECKIFNFEQRFIQLLECWEKNLIIEIIRKVCSKSSCIPNSQYLFILQRKIHFSTCSNRCWGKL